MQANKLYNVIKSSRMSEKAVACAEEHRQVLFNVAVNATKTEIKHAVEKIFNVVVMSVKTAVVKGKKKKTRQKEGKRKDFKKAYVKLAEGHDIDFLGSE